MNRFDLEERMTACWNTKDDIDLLCESVLEKEMTKDEIINALIGIAQLHEMRCDRAFESFKYLVGNGTIGSGEPEMSSEDQLEEYLNSYQSGQFTPYALYDTSRDCVQAYFKDQEYYVEPVNDNLELYVSLETGEIVGVKIVNLREVDKI